MRVLRDRLDAADSREPGRAGRRPTAGAGIRNGVGGLSGASFQAAAGCQPAPASLGRAGILRVGPAAPGEP